MKIDTSKKPITNNPQPKPEPQLSKPKPSNTSIVQLPSNGKLYGGKSSVEISFLKTVDVKRLYNIVVGTSTDSIERLLGNKIHDFDSNELVTHDLWYVAYWIRINSFDKHPIRLNWVCQNVKGDGTKCNRQNKSEVRGKNLKIIQIDENFSEPVTLKLSDYGETQVRLPRVKDDINTSAFLNKYLGDKVTPGDTWLCNILALIDDEKSLEEKYKLAKEEKITSDDLFDLQMFETEFAFGVGDTIDLTCVGCGEVSRHPFRLRTAHFLPQLGDTSNIRDAVRFGNARSSESN